jgi:hypothetical protein
MSITDTAPPPAWALALLATPVHNDVCARVATISDCKGYYFELERGRWQFFYGTAEGYAALLDHEGAETTLSAGWRHELAELRELLNDPRMVALLEGKAGPQ